MFISWLPPFRAPVTSSPESALITPDPDGPFLVPARPHVRRHARETTDAGELVQETDL